MAEANTDPGRTRRLPVRQAVPFWLAVVMPASVLLAAWLGGLWLIAVPVLTWAATMLLDLALGDTSANLDPDTDARELYWYTLVTRLWLPIQLGLIFGLLWWVGHGARFSTAEALVLFAGVGLVTGTVGINFSHELMHQPGRGERLLGDLLACSVLYGHFRSSHLHVHHVHVATPGDPATARFDEPFYGFLVRALAGSFRKGLGAEAARLARRGLPAWHGSNPFWRYAVFQAGFLAAAWAVAGWFGVALFALQAAVAVFELELVGYVEHYGLTRRQRADGGWEPVRPCHSWNSAKTVSNWLLINLQRHSDHHYKPARRFPLLQDRPGGEAPQLPFSYSAMSVLALVPPLWRRVMNPRVEEWRRHFYPGIRDWA